MMDAFCITLICIQFIIWKLKKSFSLLREVWAGITNVKRVWKKFITTQGLNRATTVCLTAVYTNPMAMILAVLPLVAQLLLDMRTA